MSSDFSGHGGHFSPGDLFDGGRRLRTGVLETDGYAGDPYVYGRFDETVRRDDHGGLGARRRVLF